MNVNAAVANVAGRLLDGWRVLQAEERLSPEEAPEQAYLEMRMAWLYDGDEQAGRWYEWLTGQKLGRRSE